MKKFSKIVAILLTVAMLVMASATLIGCNNDVDDGTHTYNDTFITSPSTWNPHTYETNDDAYPITYITTGLYEFFFNSTYDGYEIKPQMAAADPVDVSSRYYGSTIFNVPNGETGYAYEIELNQMATWQNGVSIKADDYIYSMQQLIDPDMLNRRADTYIEGSSAIQNANAYYLQNSPGTYPIIGDKTDAEIRAMIANGEVFTTFDKELSAYFGWMNAPASVGGNTMKVYWEYFEEYHEEFIVGQKQVGVDDEGNPVFEPIYLMDKWADAPLDDNGMIIVTEELYEDLLIFNGNFGGEIGELVLFYQPPTVTPFENVGIIKTGEYKFVIIYEKPISGFYLLYNLTSNWLVYKPYYEAGKRWTAGTYSSTYATTVASTMSYGPYKLTSFQVDKEMIFERNTSWFAYNPDYSGYEAMKNMYQTDRVVATRVTEASTRKDMFLRGDIETYGLQAADYAEYRNSQYFRFTPGVTVFFLILSGHPDLGTVNEDGSIGKDTATVNKSMLLNEDFRQAMAVAFNKDEFAAEISPARSGAYGIIGTSYIWDPYTGETYRSTDEAMQVLVDYYGLTYGPGEKYTTLEQAYKAITGYDAELAKELFVKAFDEESAAGRFKDGQIVTIDYSASAINDFINQTIDYLNAQLARILADTPYAGKLVINAKLTGTAWSDDLKNGNADTCLAGWTGGIMDPFSLMNVYVNAAVAYDGKWFNAKTSELTLDIDINGQIDSITFTMYDWYLVLNGTTMTSKEGKAYNFGFDIINPATGEKADSRNRLAILAGMEGFILNTGTYIPMLQDAGGFLKSQKWNYVTDVYNPVMGRGGIAYLTYNYTDKEWDAYRKNGLNYK